MERSKSSRLLDRNDLNAAGARLVWVVEPERDAVVEYRTLPSPRRLGAADTLDGGDVLPGLAIEVRTLFAE